MAKEKSTKKKLAPIYIFEIVFYVVMGAIALWGLVYIVLGLISMYWPGVSSSNPLLGFSNTIKRLFGLHPLWWGVLLFSFGAICIAVALICVNRTVDKEKEKEDRRAARLAHIKQIEEEEEALENTPAPEEEPQPIPLNGALEEPIEETETPTEEPVSETAEETPVEEPAPEPVEETLAVEPTPAEEPAPESVEEAPVVEATPVEEPAPEPVNETPTEKTEPEE